MRATTLVDKEQDKVGCEEYLYKEMVCCLHPCPVTECPEPVCAITFPGGMKSYLRYKEMRVVLEAGTTINEAAGKLGISVQTLQRHYNKVRNL